MIPQLRSPRTHAFLAAALVALFVGPALLSADAPRSCPATETASLADSAPVLVPTPVDGASLPKASFVDSCIQCTCSGKATPPVTKWGLLCLQARQRAAAAARALAVCDPGVESCGSVTHSVEPCVADPQVGYTATATAYYGCERCEDICH